MLGLKFKGLNMNYENECMNKTGKKNRIVLWFIFAFLLFCFIAFLWYFIVMYRFFNPGYITTTEDFRQKLSKSLDVIQVRDWLKDLSDAEIQQIDNKRFQALEFPLKLPNSVNNLKREMSYITIIKDDRYGVCMRLSWGGPIARWGVVVGPQDMPIPETEDVSYEKGYRQIGEYRVKLEDGAYVWHEIK